MFRNKKAILLIHGFVGGIYDYDTLPNELQITKNFDVFSYTLPGHEKSIVSNVKYEDWIKKSIEQIEFLKKHKYKEIYIIGHSMGGVIATHLASIYPEIKKIVLVAPAFRYFYFKDGKINIKNISETLKNIPEIFKDNEKEKVIERIKKTPLSTMIEFSKLVSEYQLDVNKIKCPILIIRGTKDTIVPPESTEYIYENVKSKTINYYIIKDITHDCFTLKRSEEVKNIIINFLKNKPNNYKIKKEI